MRCCSRPATGPDLAYLAGTVALDATGAPLQRAGISRTVPGLAYVGLEFQRSFRSNTAPAPAPTHDVSSDGSPHAAPGANARVSRARVATPD